MEMVWVKCFDVEFARLLFRLRVIVWVKKKKEEKYAEAKWSQNKRNVSSYLSEEKSYKNKDKLNEIIFTLSKCKNYF